ncbi:hypothetical protein HDV00_003064 [Rhizophlyctis rosea]|nr:hypothetical protein HDV00_003064 [Rhizophlyctis rosea]
MASITNYARQMPEYSRHMHLDPPAGTGPSLELPMQEFRGGPTASQSSHMLISRHADIGRVARWKQKDLMARRNGPHSTVYMTNGDWYLGEWRDDMKHGNGTYYYHKTGSIYEGEWSHDVRSGFGTYSVPLTPPPLLRAQKTSSPFSVHQPPESSSSTHKRLTPHASQNTPMRKIYAGEWLADVRHGRGTCFFDDGGVYDGGWVGDVRQGWGKMIYAGETEGEAGEVYEGEWFEGMRHGQGILLLPNGNRYEGTWFNDQKEGPGKFIYRTKRQCYEGEWAKDMPKCGTLRDLPPLMGTQPRKYPIPPLTLADPQGVLENEREMLLEDRMHRMTGEVSVESEEEA